MSNWNSDVIEEFRANGGKVGGFYEGANLLLLTTTGRKSGKRYTTPLAYQTDGDDLIVIAANVGANKNPDWYYNLLTHPEVTIEVGNESFTAIASIVEGEKREHFLAIGRAAWAEAQEQWKEMELEDIASDEEHHIPVISLKRK